MKKILALDIGGGTQDILLYDPAKNLENCLQMVLPSPTQLVAAKISKATAAGRPLFLHGEIMGGGASTRAIKKHLAAGLPVVATPQAALTIHDDLARVAKLGIMIDGEEPPGAVPVRLGDIDVAMLKRLLSEAGEELPTDFAVAVQDHGYAPQESNRAFRFRYWGKFMADGGSLSDLFFRSAPSYFTRMKAAQQTLPGALLMDTCSAALLGAMTDERVREAASHHAVAIANIGNQHTFIAIIRKERVEGLLEHHTGSMTAEKIIRYLDRLLTGTLTNSEVLADGGHGSIAPPGRVLPALVAVTGPRRNLLAGKDFYFAAPQGNMMLMGCFGLVAAAKKELISLGGVGAR
ncbi:MAG: DUF1786 domain-containing protein [Dethiobacter sp.]|nr:DUF1786 domain-containing protein [Dethiobacter sp.]